MPQQLAKSGDDPFDASADGFLSRAMLTGRHSAELAGQLHAHVINRSANIFQILDEIKTLENPDAPRASRTKPQSQFKGKWLTGLWHKHYAQARFIATNLMLHWSHSGLLDLIKDSYGGREYFDEEAAKNLAHRFVIDGYAKRSGNGKLTGEWIVFAKQDGKIYYLTLGAHTEEDEAIWQRCRACATEFPELKIIQADR